MAVLKLVRADRESQVPLHQGDTWGIVWTSSIRKRLYSSRFGESERHQYPAGVILVDRPKPCPHNTEDRQITHVRSFLETILGCLNSPPA